VEENPIYFFGEDSFNRLSFSGIEILLTNLTENENTFLINKYPTTRYQNRADDN
jgi:hypothetical protein